MGKFFVVFLLVGILSSACSNQSNSPSSEPEKTGPRFQDTVLDLSQVGSGIEEALADRELTVTTEEVYRTGEELIILGLRSGQRNVQLQGHNLLKSFYSQDRSVRAEKNAYLEALLGAKQSDLGKVLQARHESVSKDLHALDRVGREVRLVFADSPAFSSVLNQIINFLNYLNVELKNRGATPSLLASYDQKLNHEIRPKFDGLKWEASHLDQKIKLRETISLIGSANSKLNGAGIIIDLPLGTVQSMETKLNSVADAGQALSLLIDVWFLMSSDQRKTLFGGQNPDFFNYISQKSDHELRIIQNGPSPVMHPLFYSTVKYRLIPGIQSYGVENLKSKLDAVATEQLKERFKQAVLIQAVGLASVITPLLKPKVEEELREVKKLQAHQTVYFSEQIDSWTRREFFADGSQLPAIEPLETYVAYRQGRPEVVGFGPAVQMTTPGTLGSVLSGSALRWTYAESLEGLDSSSQRFLRLILSQINKLTLADRNVAFKRKSDYSLESKLLLLNGYSRTANYFKDWIPNGFDIKIGRFLMGEAITGLDPTVNRARVFPKENLFGTSLVLAVSTAEDVYAQLNSVENLKTRDIALALLTLKTFEEATQDFEKSKSTSINQNLSRIEKVKYLVKESELKLGQMLSEKLRSTENMVLRDQLLAVRALIELSKKTGSEKFLWSALDGYYALNAHLWNAEKGYYSDGKVVPSYLDFVELGLTLQALQAQIPSKSRPQLDKIQRSIIGVLGR